MQTVAQELWCTLKRKAMPLFAPYYSTGIIALHSYTSLYFFIPKVACTSLKLYCAALLNFPIETRAKRAGIPPEWYVHRPSVTRFPTIRRNTLSQYQDYFRFCFVRNPWDRLVSFYVSKLQRHHHPEFTALDGMYADMPFAELVHLVCSTPDAQANVHFRSQHTFVCDSEDNLLVNFVGKLESLEQDMAKIRSVAGFPSTIALPHANQLSRDPYSTFYTPELRNMVAERFAKDIALFDYDF